MGEATGGVTGAAMESGDWLVQWPVSIPGLEASSNTRRNLPFSFSWWEANPSDVPFLPCSSDVRFSLTPELWAGC